MLSDTINDVNEIIADLNSRVNQFKKEEALSELPSMKRMQSKEVIGALYRDDQIYYEKLAYFKSEYFGIKAFLYNLKKDNTGRVESRTIDLTIEFLDSRSKMIDEMLSAAKQRLKFFESSIYLISNMTYGSF